MMTPLPRHFTNSCSQEGILGKSPHNTIQFSYQGELLETENGGGKPGMKNQLMQLPHPVNIMVFHSAHAGPKSKLDNMGATTFTKVRGGPTL